MNRLVAFALFAALVVASVSAQCTFTDGVTGCVYDLSSLTIQDTNATFYQYEVKDGNAAGRYEANVCGPLNPVVANGTDVAVSQTTADTTPQVYSCGTASSISFAAYTGNVIDPTLPCQGVQITYSEGTLCPGKAVARNTILNVGCNANYTDAQLVSVEEGEQCDYKLQMYSAAACGALNAATTTESPSISTSSSTSGSPVASPDAASASPSVSESSSETATVSGSPSALPSVVDDGSQSMSVSTTTSETPSESVTTSLTVSASPLPSLSVGASPYATFTPSTTPVSSGSGGNGWIWWVVGAVAIVLIVIAVGVAGFVVYRKKQQSYDSIGYE